MKVLFYYTGAPSPILETMLELMKVHQSKKDSITLYECDSNLSNCFWNPSKSLLKCIECKSKLKNSHELFEDNSINYRVFKKKSKILANFPEKFLSVQELQNYTYDNKKIGMAVASRLISLYRDHLFDTESSISQIHRELTTAIQVYETLKSEFIENKPDLVYIFNGRITTEYPVVELCKFYGINFYTYEISYAPNKYSLRYNSTAHSIDAMSKEIEELWNAGPSNKEQIAKSWFQSKKNGKDIFKIENFTKEQKPTLLPSNFDKSKKNIAIFNSTIDEFSSIDGWENIIYDGDDTFAIDQILSDLKDDTNIYFHLRVHPNLKNASPNTSQLLDLKKLADKHNNLNVIWPAESIDSYQLLEDCDIVLVFSSTIGIEAAFWSKPVILASRAFYESLDCIYKPKTHNELISLIKSDLKPLNSQSALKYGFREVTNGVEYKYFQEKGLDKKTNLPYGIFKGQSIKVSGIASIISIGRKIKNYIKK
jgi:hypothetical protein